MSSSYFQVFRSQLKLNLLTSLLEGEKNLSSLGKELGASGSTIIHAFTDLEALKLMERDGRYYKLTSLGFIEAQFIKETDSALKVLEKYRDFWLTHDVSAIPSHLLRRLGDLEESVLVQNDSEDLEKVHTTFQQILLTSKKVQGVSPIFHPDFIKVFQLLLEDGANVELILTRGVFEKTLSLVEIKPFERYIAENRLSVYMAEELRVALTVTENSFSMGLFSNNADYDYTKDIVSISLKTIKWGEDLFKHFLTDTIKLSSEDIERFRASAS